MFGPRVGLREGSISGCKVRESARSDVHAKSTEITHDYINFQKFDRSYTYIFSVIAIIVLIIAYFMTLMLTATMIIITL